MSAAGSYCRIRIATAARDLVVGALFVLTLSGCTNAIRGPTFPEGDSGPGQVMPLRHYLGSNTTGGIAFPPATVVKVFLVHGMTHSDSTWADTLIQNIAARLGMQLDIKSCDPIPVVTASSQGHPANLCFVSASHDGVQYKFYALQWSPLTDPFKCMAPFLSDREDGDPIQHVDKSHLCPNAGHLHYPVRRAVVNGRLIKDVVLDDGFPDVVLYLAPNYGPVFREAVAAALCYMYFDMDTALAGQPCGPHSLPTPPLTEQYVFVTHSLGANVLLDTLCEQIHCGEPPLDGPPLAQTRSVTALQQAIYNSFSRPTPIYLLANQYVLLALNKAVPIVVHPPTAHGSSDLAELTATQGGAELFDIRNHPLFNSMAARHAPGTSTAAVSAAGTVQARVDVVAFSDPNDDLSFLLPTFPNSVQDPSTVSVQNVFVTNAPELLWLIENPSDAHLGYVQNPKGAGILDVMFCGMTTTGLTRC